jgi:hypothetical protein
VGGVAGKERGDVVAIGYGDVEGCCEMKGQYGMYMRNISQEDLSGVLYLRNSITHLEHHVSYA